MTPSMRTVAAAFAALALAVGTSALAQSQYPNKPIRLVLQFPAGGLADTVCRVLANPLSQQLGQPIIVDNRPGADGAIAGETVARAAPDGYTLFFATNSALSAVPAMRKTPPYDPVADFTPISFIGRFPFFVFAHPGIPAKTLADFVVYARANPGKLNYGTGNTTSIMATAQLSMLANLPRDIVERLAREFNAAILKPEVKEPLDRFGYELQGSTSQELGVFVKDQFELWKRAVREAGIPPE